MEQVKSIPKVKTMDSPGPGLERERLVRGLLLTYSEPEKAWVYTSPDASMRLFYDPAADAFLPATVDPGTMVYREREAGRDADGASYVRERVIYDAGTATPKDVEKAAFYAELKTAEANAAQADFWLSFWQKMHQMRHVFPVAFTACFLYFVWEMEKVAIKYGAQPAGEMAGEAFATVGYLSIFGLAGIVALFVLKYAGLALFSSPSQKAEPVTPTTEQTTAAPGFGQTIINVQSGAGTWSQQSPAQDILNQRQ